MAWYDITGTVADWVMAGAAIYAASQAHKWVNSKMNNDLYHLSKEVIVNNHEFIYNYFLNSARASKYYTAIISRAKNNDNFVGMLPSLESIKKEIDKINEMYEIKVNLESNMRMLNKLGFSYEKNKAYVLASELDKIYFSSFVIHLKTFWDTLYAHVLSLQEIEAEYRDSTGVYKYLEDLGHTIMGHADEARSLYKKFDKLYDSPIKYFDKN